MQHSVIEFRSHYSEYFIDQKNYSTTFLAIVAVQFVAVLQIGANLM